MEIKVITRHGPSNYGSILQSIATLKVLETLGHDASIIDYQRKDERGLSGILTQLKAKSNWNNPVKKIAYILLRWPMEAIATRKFDKMRKHYLKLTKRISDKDELLNVKADIYLTGSDQVWGPIGPDKYDGAYFLDFVKDKPKLAFAASFGRTQFDKDVKNAYSKYLKDYDAIAVRENTAIDTLCDFGITDANQVLDPTLLLSSKEWEKEVGLMSNPDKEYILIYQIHNNPALDEYAKKLSDRTGLPIVRVSPSLHQVKRVGKFKWLPDLNDFLSLIKNATLMVTDSFHGTAFAINFNTQFIEILPNNATGSRNQSILNLTGLSNRIVNDLNDFSIADKQIDYAEVNKIIEKERSRSLSILLQMINSTIK